MFNNIIRFVLSCFGTSIILLAVAGFNLGKESIYEQKLSGAFVRVKTSTEVSCHGSNGRSLLLVSTLDGKLSALDSQSGHLVWSHESSGPLLSSSLSAIKGVQDLVKLRFIPSLDGILFQLNGDHIEPLPFTTENLVGKIQRLPDGSHVIGGKEISLSGIDIISGETYYHCSSTGCYPLTRKHLKIAERDILVVRRTQQTVRAINQRTGIERWNFSVATMELELSEEVQNFYRENQNCATAEQQAYNADDYSFNIAEGTVTSGTHDSGKGKHWTVHFGSPLAGIWRLHNNILEPMDLFKYSLLKGVNDKRVLEQPLRYMGIHEGQIYIQHPVKVSFTSSNNPEGDTRYSNQVSVVVQPFLGGWKPYISSSPSRTPALMNDRRLTIWNSLDYPYDNGFYLLATRGGRSISDLARRAKPTVASEENNRTQEEAREEIEWRTFFKSWKKSLPVALALAIPLTCILICLVFLIRKGVKKCQKPAVNMIIDEVATVAEEPIAAIGRTRTSTSQHDCAPSTSQSGEYMSRYDRDFEHVKFLGKGGFGVVFEAISKVDERNYAVKRIQIPNCEEARVKVMREVKALANLDHPGIVRYFGSWLEDPPEGWQEKNDKLYYKNSDDEGFDPALSQDWCARLTTDESERESDTCFPSSTCTSKSIEDTTRETHVRRDALDFKDENGCNLDSSTSCGIEFREDKCSSKSNMTVAEKVEGHETLVRDEVSNSSQICVIHDLEEAGPHENGTSKIERKSYKTRSLQSRKQQCRRPLKTKEKYVGKCCMKSEVCIKTSPSFLYIQLQLCKRETLKDWLWSAKPQIRKERGLVIFRQIVDAVSYFHSQGMMHRDLKPSNIFFDSKNNVKVGDFGLVTAITRPAVGQDKGVREDFSQHTGKVGTQLYMSPEQMNCQPYDHKVDIYSIGVILLELLQVFRTQSERISVLTKLRVGILPDDFVKSYQLETELVKSLVAEEPTLRLEASQISERLNNNGLVDSIP